MDYFHACQQSTECCGVVLDTLGANAVSSLAYGKAEWTSNALTGLSNWTDDRVRGLSNWTVTTISGAVTRETTDRVAALASLSSSVSNARDRLFVAETALAGHTYAIGQLEVASAAAGASIVGLQGEVGVLTAGAVATGATVAGLVAAQAVTSSSVSGLQSNVTSLAIQSGSQASNVASQITQIGPSLCNCIEKASWASNLATTNELDIDILNGITIPPLSNAVLWSSNAVRWTSNAISSGLLNSSDAIWGSNTSRWASNAVTQCLPLAGGTVGGLTVLGDFHVTGSLTSIATSELKVNDNMITLNDGYVGMPLPALFSGIEIERGTEANYYIAFQESTGLFKAGTCNALQALATRDDNMSSGFAYYSAGSSKLTNKNIEVTDVTGLSSNLAAKLDASTYIAPSNALAVWSSNALSNYTTNTALSAVGQTASYASNAILGLASSTALSTVSSTANTALSIATVASNQAFSLCNTGGGGTTVVTGTDPWWRSSTDTVLQVSPSITETIVLETRPSRFGAHLDRASNLVVYSPSNHPNAVVEIRNPGLDVAILSARADGMVTMSNLTVTGGVVASLPPPPPVRQFRATWMLNSNQASPSGIEYTWSNQWVFQPNDSKLGTFSNAQSNIVGGVTLNGFVKAPVTGMYVFSMNIGGANSSTMRMGSWFRTSNANGIFPSGQVVGEGLDHPANVMILRLASNDSVSVRVYNSASRVMYATECLMTLELLNDNVI